MVPPLAAALVDRVRAEYMETTGLALTPSQAQRLFDLEPESGAAVLSTLCDSGFLMRDAMGQFRRRVCLASASPPAAR